jgi:hypothetical protein
MFSFSPVAWASFLEPQGEANCNFGSKEDTFFVFCEIFLFLVIKTLDPELDPDPQLENMPDPDQH